LVPGVELSTRVAIGLEYLDIISFSRQSDGRGYAGYSGSYDYGRL